MLVKYFLTCTLTFAFILVSFFSLYEFGRRNGKEFENLLDASAIFLILTIAFGSLTLAVYLVWGV